MQIISNIFKSLFSFLHAIKNIYQNVTKRLQLGKFKKQKSILISNIKKIPLVFRKIVTFIDTRIINFFELNRERIEHNRKIKELTKQYANVDRLPSHWIRFIIVLITGLFSLFIYIYFFKSNNEETVTVLFSLKHLFITAPVLFFLWWFRDQNRLFELKNNRKDTNLKEFQRLQEWATGNIPDKYNEQGEAKPEAIALQISALHSLRPYLKGEFGEDFRRGAFEIYASVLHTQHQKIIQRLTGEEKNYDNIHSEIAKCELTKQINRIASEEWFNLLINHNFPTKTLSLMGVDLSGKYLRHKEFGKSIDLSNTNLQATNLSRAQLQNAVLEEAQLQNAVLSNAQLQNADLWLAQLQNANLSGAQLQNAVLEEAQLQNADLSWTQLQNARLNYAQLQNAKLEFAQLQNAKLNWAQLQNADLWRAQLQNAKLNWAKLQNAKLNWAQLQNAKLNRAQLQNADLAEVGLQATCLEKANFQAAKLVYTDFRGAVSNSDDYSANFADGINNRIGKDADLRGIDKKLLDSKQIEAIKNKLAEFVDDEELNQIIKRIKAAKSTFTKDKTTKTGSYTKEEADIWIAKYNEAMDY